MSVVKIQERFGKESERIMQAEINKAEANGEFLSTIILSTPHKPSEVKRV